MDGDQVVNGVLNYIEAEIMPGMPRLSRFVVKWLVRIARDWKLVRLYIEEAGKK